MNTEIKQVNGEWCVFLVIGDQKFRLAPVETREEAVWQEELLREALGIQAENQDGFTTEKLRKLRDDGLISIRELSKRIGVSDDTVYSYMRKDLNFAKKYSGKTKRVLREHIDFIKSLIGG